ncbi:hypothetical protein TUM4433_32300 [Shewanella schlegeliana]|nr:hypothetical protein TUM4433_32300 [Shewanella schlegeliana]
MFSFFKLSFGGSISKLKMPQYELAGEISTPENSNSGLYFLMSWAIRADFKVLDRYTVIILR